MQITLIYTDLRWKTAFLGKFLRGGRLQSDYIEACNAYAVPCTVADDISSHRVVLLDAIVENVWRDSYSFLC